MKKAIYFLAFALLIAMLSRCNSAPQPQQTQPSTFTTEAPKASSSSFLVDTVAYSNGGIEVVMKNLNDMKSFDFEISNTTDRDIHFMVGGAAINNCMVYDLVLSNTVTPDNKAIVTYDFSGAKAYGITCVETIDLYLQFFDGSDIFAEPICHAEATREKDFSYMPDFDVFFENDYVSAFLEQKGGHFQDFNVVYYNKTNGIISACIVDPSINGIMLSNPILNYTYILPGCFAYTGIPTGTITLYNALDEEIKDKGLDQVENISGKVYLSVEELQKSIVSEQITIFPAMETENVL